MKKEGKDQPLGIGCDCWAEDDAWKGLCKTPSVTVRGSSFEDAKKNHERLLVTQYLAVWV